MIIVLKKDATDLQIRQLEDKISSWGLSPHVSRGKQQTIIGAIGDESILREKPISALSYVEKVLAVVQPYKLANRQFHPDDTVIDLGDGVLIGGGNVSVMAGPCSVESHDGLMTIADAVSRSGATILRGGAFKPRSSPYSFQGLGKEGLKYLSEAGRAYGLKIITELMNIRDLDDVAGCADIIQIGTRNMQNYDLLKAVGQSKKPVMIKRGLAATIEELLMSAEYVMHEGNSRVMVCERGIRTFETWTRNTLDISCVPAVHELSHLPVIVDPSHAAGRAELVSPLSLAGIAAGADGLMIEVHDHPEEAFSDGRQSLVPDAFFELMQSVKSMCGLLGVNLVTGNS